MYQSGHHSPEQSTLLPQMPLFSTSFPFPLSALGIFQALCDLSPDVDIIVAVYLPLLPFYSSLLTTMIPGWLVITILSVCIRKSVLITWPFSLMYSWFLVITSWVAGVTHSQDSLLLLNKQPQVAGVGIILFMNDKDLPCLNIYLFIVRTGVNV